MELVKYKDMTKASYAGSSIRFFAYGSIIKTLDLSDKKPFHKEHVLIETASIDEVLFLFAFIFI